jgi:predicted Co/Zn/Cd cation transporter (cation efflux family)
MTAVQPGPPEPPPRHSEQAVLRTSIVVTVLVAALGIVFGLLSGSYAIVFDGVYSLFDAGMTVVALLVANLIAGSTSGSLQNRRLVERFTMGFWHLEPMVLAMSGLMLLAAAAYAFINAIGSFLNGGRELDFGQAIAYAAVTVLACAAMTAYDLRANRRLRSQLVALDAKAWMMSGAITAALLVAFLAGLAIRGTELAWMAPYIDPAVLALVCLAIIPVPLGTVRRALADILLVTPAELKQHVDEVARQVVQAQGFLSYRAYVARVGRGRQIELYFIAPPGWPARTLEQWDALRDRISEAIGGESPDRWLTIAFTTDAEWAE